MPEESAKKGADKSQAQYEGGNGPEKGFEERTKGSKDCSEPVIVGRPSTRYDYVPKHHNEDNDFDADLKELLGEECEP